MDERILVEVRIPAAQRILTMYVPAYQKVNDIQIVLFPFIERVCVGAFICTDETMLYSKRLHCVLPKEQYLKDTGIRHADILYLF